MIKRFAELLGLDNPDTATQESVEAALATMKTGVQTAAANSAAFNAATLQVTTEKQRADAEKLRADKAAADLATAEAARAALNTRVISVTLDRAIETGRITKGQRAEWETRAALNSETVCADLLKLRPRLNLGPVNLDRSSQAKAAMNSAAAQTQINDLVKAALPKHKGNVQAAYNAVTRDSKNKALVAALSGSAATAE
jgi:hypothetical protein